EHGDALHRLDPALQHARPAGAVGALRLRCERRADRPADRRPAVRGGAALSHRPRLSGSDRPSPEVPRPLASRTLLQGPPIVTMEEALGDFASADILIEDGAILAVGPSLDAAGSERIDGTDMIALPGIIDAHTCLWQTVLRGYVPDLWPGGYFSKF